MCGAEQRSIGEGGASLHSGIAGAEKGGLESFDHSRCHLRHWHTRQLPLLRVRGQARPLSRHPSGRAAGAGREQSRRVVFLCTVSSLHLGTQNMVPRCSEQSSGQANGLDGGGDLRDPAAASGGGDTPGDVTGMKLCLWKRTYQIIEFPAVRKVDIRCESDSSEHM